MLSRISIDVDNFNQPIIKVEYKASDDVRDKLVKRFLETFGSESMWAEVIFRNTSGKTTEAIITPINSKELKETVKEMKEWAEKA